MCPAVRGDGAGGAGTSGESGDLFVLMAEFERYIAHLSFAEVARGALQFLDERPTIARASMALLQGDGASFRIFEATTEIVGAESGKVIAFDSASLGATVERRAPVYREDLRTWPHPNALDAAFLAAGIVCTFSVPLLSGGACLGTLNGAAREVDGIDAATRKLMELVAPRLAFAIHVGKAHDELAESEARFRDVFATVGDGLIVAESATRRIVMLNPAMCAMLGRRETEVIDLTVESLHPADRLEQTLTTFAALADGRQDHALDIPLLRADGTVFTADVTARRTTLSGRACVVGVFRDATARRQQEQEQVRVQKLESIGVLAAGMAHDFNNVLTEIIGHVSLARCRVEELAEARELLDGAERAAFRATALTRQLLTFAKGGAPVRSVIDLVPIVRDAARLACSGSNVRCELELTDRRVPVLGDGGQLAQVVQNVVINAVESMPGGGTVRIAVSAGREQDGAGEEAILEVHDQGPGIDPAILERVFLPFFTTKTTGRGLGLAVSYSIVRAHLGRIAVAPGRGGGTVVRIALPLTSGGATAVPAPAPSEPHGTGRVLVMDDHAAILEFAQRTLRGAGYETRGAANGEEAVAAYRDGLESGRPFDAVILDLTVPGGMGGREAAAAILSCDPRARLMVSSGYSEDAVMADPAAGGFHAVLPKPYSAPQLVSAVAQLLRPTG